MSKPEESKKNELNILQKIINIENHALQKVLKTNYIVGKKKNNIKMFFILNYFFFQII